MLLSAAAAFAAVSLAFGGNSQRASNGQHAPSASSAPAWLGIDLTSFPIGGGAIVANVAPGSPAQAAGLEPGDAITQFDNQPVATPSDVESTLAAMHAGQRVEIGYARGPIPFSTQVTLAARPSGP